MIGELPRYARTVLIAAASINLATSLAVPVMGQDSAPDQAVVSDARVDLIETRRALMSALSTQMQVWESQGEAPAGDPLQLYASSQLMEQILRSFPVLFTPETNPASSDFPAGTTSEASPAIWEDFAAFVELTNQGADLAASIASVTDGAKFQELVGQARRNCTECHELYLEYSVQIPSSDDLGDAVNSLGSFL